MTSSRRAPKAAVTLVAAAFGLTMAGCSGDDVAFNGKIFDAVGMGATTHAAEPKMAARSPVVVPPGLERLPEPGTPATSALAEADLAAINDPEKVERMKKSDLERQQVEYCKENYEMPKLRGKQDLEEVAGPLGPCRVSFASVWDNFNKPVKQEGQLEE